MAKREPDRRRATAEEPGPIGRAVRGLVTGVFRAVWAFLWRVTVIVALITGVSTLAFLMDLPEPEELFDGRATGSVTLTDREGSVFAWRGEQYGGELRASDASPHLVHAIVAAEDKRFWSHFGLDPRGIARAVWANLQAGRVVQGGSTLTQQVAKNVFLDAERSLDRKLKEVPMALALELKYTKEEILSIYLNRVYLGAGTYGFEAASRRYFGKSARALDPSEAAMLAGLLRAPSRYAPTNDLSLAQGRASVIVRLMGEQGYLSEAQVFDALAAPADLSTAAERRTGAAFADWVMETAPTYLARRTTEDVAIATTFDPAMQAAAEAAVASVYAEKVKDESLAQTAVVVMDRGGAVRAMVGGRGDKAGRFNRATQALRQTGSAFKPVVYAAGLMAGLAPQSVVVDAPITIDGWSPQNYDREHRGPVTLTEALAHSINTVAVRVSERAGRERVRSLARAMGVTTPLAPGPAIALGTSEATLIDMTSVYATIANGGRAARPFGIREVKLRGDETPLLRHSEDIGERVLDPLTARRLTHMLHRVVEDGTGRRARIPGHEVAGKTGTTQAARDAWFIGFSGDLVVGVWMGNDDNTPLTGTTGGGLPAEIWRAVMERLLEGRDPGVLVMDAGPAGGPDLPEGGPLVTPTATAAGGAGSADDTLIERVFADVLEGLGAGGGGGGGGALDRRDPDR